MKERTGTASSSRKSPGRRMDGGMSNVVLGFFLVFLAFFLIVIAVLMYKLKNNNKVRKQILKSNS